MYISSDISAGLLFIQTQKSLDTYEILDASGKRVDCPLLVEKQNDGKFVAVLDASGLQTWSVDTPVLYTIKTKEETVRFGHCSLQPMQNKAVLLNGNPIYLRGYIRGIIAHDHPNMTGLSDYEAACKNIRQAKKYGFNLVRFHSTVPSEEFVRAADELGLLIHMEIGFAYEYDSQGNKQNLSMNNNAWVQTILRYRNHPSVAIFCIGNEMHNAGRYPEVRALYDLGKQLAPAKLIMDNSGWGEYDRATADIYSQHIAYFFPYKHHGDMFLSDAPWSLNGSVNGEPLEVTTEAAQAHRYAIPIRPTLSHEAVHYIHIPDYEALGEKFDRFAAQVGEEYLRSHGIKKPKFMTELPKLIARKGLAGDMADYRDASMQFKNMGTKVFLERLRLADNLCGYEMLQFSDCLKYENKNGIVDCFDDDKGINDGWMRQFNSDLVLLAELSHDTIYEDETLIVTVSASDYLPRPQIRGTLTVKLDGKTVYEGFDFALAGGLQKLVRLQLRLPKTCRALCHEISASFASKETATCNDWLFWSFPRANRDVSKVFVTDTLDEEVFAQLSKGKTVLLQYEYGAKRNTWLFPGAMERFKPCIWDRGSNLGGIIYNDILRQTLGGQRYFDRNVQSILEAGSKVNLDHFPFPVQEHMRGVDKPVRDRMKGMIHGIKHFIDDDTLRKFSHLFSVRVGEGLLIVTSLNLTNQEDPVTANVLSLLTQHPEVFDTEKTVEPETLKAWLEKINADGFAPEDVMNHFWELDNKAVEDTLFWEETGVDLAQLKE